jgi:hypothetical protein
MRDEKGKAGVMLAVGKGGVTLDLCDEDGNLRAGLDVDKDGPGLVLCDEKGKVIGSAP